MTHPPKSCPKMIVQKMLFFESLSSSDGEPSSIFRKIKNIFVFYVTVAFQNTQELYLTPISHGKRSRFILSRLKKINLRRFLEWSIGLRSIKEKNSYITMGFFSWVDPMKMWHLILDFDSNRESSFSSLRGSYEEFSGVPERFSNKVLRFLQKIFFWW